MRIANAIFLLPPFSGGGKKGIIQRPKCNAFDTGFVTYSKAWKEIREEDRGILWEHLVLDMLRVLLPDNKIYYWQDKSKREIDFIIPRENNNIDVIECTLNPAHFNVQPINLFREFYPQGRNVCLCPYITAPYPISDKNIMVNFTSNIQYLLAD